MDYYKLGHIIVVSLLSIIQLVLLVQIHKKITFEEMRTQQQSPPNTLRHQRSISPTKKSINLQVVKESEQEDSPRQKNIVLKKNQSDKCNALVILPSQYPEPLILQAENIQSERKETQESRINTIENQAEFIPKRRKMLPIVFKQNHRIIFQEAILGWMIAIPLNYVYACVISLIVSFVMRMIQYNDKEVQFVEIITFTIFAVGTILYLEVTLTWTLCILVQIPIEVTTTFLVYKLALQLVICCCNFFSASLLTYLVRRKVNSQNKIEPLEKQTSRKSPRKNSKPKLLTQSSFKTRFELQTSTSRNNTQTNTPAYFQAMARSKKKSNSQILNQDTEPQTQPTISQFPEVNTEREKEAIETFFTISSPEPSNKINYIYFILRISIEQLINGWMQYFDIDQNLIVSFSLIAATLTRLAIKFQNNIIVFMTTISLCIANIISVQFWNPSDIIVFIIFGIEILLNLLYYVVMKKLI
ncbi:hypothetical protein pb186bvf_005918 [Paramecium bursaria]